MKRLLKTTLAGILCVCLCASIVPFSFSALAEGEEQNENSLPEKDPIVLSLSEDIDNAYDNYVAINNAFAQADAEHYLKISIETPGLYPVHGTAEGALRIRSNIEFDLNGSTLLRSGQMSNIFQNVDFSDYRDGTGYLQTYNFTIKNGTLNGEGGTTAESNLVNIGHASNASFENIIFDTCKGGHLIELCGCKDIILSGCTFRSAEGKAASTSKEAIQLDICNNDTDEPWNSTYNPDNSNCQNITITGCTFENCPSAIGNHHTLVGHHNTNISIINNRFSNRLTTNGYAIWAFGFDNSLIQDNTFDGNYNRAIFVSGGSVDIIHNTVNNSSYIPVYITTANSYTGNGTETLQEKVTNASVKNNTLTTTGNIVPLTITSGSHVSEVSGNILSSSGANALSVTASAEDGTVTTIGTISGNNMKSPTQYGILCSTGAKITTISNNTIESYNSTIYVTSASVGTISGNTSLVSKNSYGIAAVSGGKIGTISSNAISGKDNGIYISGENSAVTTIDKNSSILSSAGKAGIYVTSTAKVTNITNNTNIKATAGSGIVVTNASASTIKSNTITGTTGNGIAVTNKATVGTISYNSITSKENCIHTSGSTITTLDHNTKITSTAGYGVYATSGSKITNVTWNTVKSNALSGICASSTGIIGKIQYNTVGSNKEYGVLVANAGITVSMGQNSYSSNTKGNEYIKATVKKLSATNLPSPVLQSVSNVYTGTKLTWGSVKFAEKYRIFYKTSASGSWTKLADTTATSYTHTAAKSGTTYYYTVRCISADAKAYTSTFDSKGLSITYVAAPKLTLQAVNGGMKLSWSKIAGASKYRIYIKTSSGWSGIADVTGTSYTYTKVATNKNYTFTIRCMDSKNALVSAYNTSGFTNKWLSVPKVPTLTNTSSGIKVTWAKTTGAAKYRLFYKTSATGSWIKIGDTTSLSYTHKATKSGTTYYYTVRCVSSDGKLFTSGFNNTGSKLKCKR